MSVLLWSTAAILTGFILDVIFGDPHRFPHVVRLIGNLIAVLEKGIRWLLPVTQGGEKSGGILLVCCVILICTGIPLLILFVCYKNVPVLGYLLESFFCYQLLAARSLKTESMKVFKSLKAGDTEGARTNISMLVGRDTSKLDNDAITRAAIETVSENTPDGITAPLLYMMLGGVSLGFLYKAVNTMDSMVGYMNDRYSYFGRAAAKTDDFLNFIPSRLCALFMVLSAYLLQFDGKNAYRIWRRDRHKHASPNSAQTEAVCAGALGIRLAGPASYHGTVIDKPYIGDDTRKVRFEDIESANRLMYLTSVLTLIFVFLMRLLGLGVATLGTL